MMIVKISVVSTQDLYLLPATTTYANTAEELSSSRFNFKKLKIKNEFFKIKTHLTKLSSLAL